MASSAADSVCQKSRELVSLDFLGAAPYGKLHDFGTREKGQTYVDILGLESKIAYDSEYAGVAWLCLKDHALIGLVILIVDYGIPRYKEFFNGNIGIHHGCDDALLDRKIIEHIPVSRVRDLG